MIFGFLLAGFGLGGAIGMWTYISNDRWYTYSPPFTSHESMMLTIFFLCVIACIAGIIIIVVSVVKKNNQDALSRLENMRGNGKIAGTCPHCGLNLASDTRVCPKCGRTVNEEKGE